MIYFKNFIVGANLGAGRNLPDILGSFFFLSKEILGSFLVSVLHWAMLLFGLLDESRPTSIFAGFVDQKKKFAGFLVIFKYFFLGKK